MADDNSPLRLAVAAFSIAVAWVAVSAAGAAGAPDVLPINVWSLMFEGDVTRLPPDTASPAPILRATGVPLDPSPDTGDDVITVPEPPPPSPTYPAPSVLDCNTPPARLMRVIPTGATTAALSGTSIAAIVSPNT